MRKGGQLWQAQVYLLHTIWSGDALSADDPWVSIQWQCLRLQIVECLIYCMASVWCHRVESGWLVICSNMTAEQLGKDAKWPNITTCTSVNIAWEASMLIWAYFSRHGDSCPSFSECINVYCSGVDMDFITLGIIVIAYINSVGLLLFSTIVSMSAWLLVWILLSTGGALAPGIPMPNFATRPAC